MTDLVAGLLALMNVDPNPGMPVNIGNPGEFSINELAEMILSMVPTASKIVYRPLPKDDPQRRRPDITRAKELLGWEPKIPLSEGLQQTAAYFSSVSLEPGLSSMTSGARQSSGSSHALSVGA